MRWSYAFATLGLFFCFFFGQVATQCPYSKRSASTHRINKRQVNNGPNCATATCNPNDRYRSYDGSCNSLANPCLGTTYRTHNRMMPADYGNGYSSFRQAINGTSPLPNSRLVSRTIHHHVPIDSHDRSHLFVGFGQFIDHDFANTVLGGPRYDSQCEGIFIPEGDAFFESPGCMFYSPSQAVLCGNGTVPNGVTCGCEKCPPGQAQQINTETSYLDGSSIYGLNEEAARELRRPGSAYLRLDKYNLPERSNNSGLFKCESKACSDQRCFQMGEMLNNQNVFLISLQTMFIRAHNRAVADLEPFYEDVETLYQEARRIVWAIMQNVVYKEQIPVVLGECVSEELKLPTPDKYLYDDTLDPQTLIECVTSACRYGHSDMVGFVRLNGRSMLEAAPLTEMFSLDLFCRTDSLELVLGGSVQQNSRQFDQYLSYEATNRMSTPFWDTFVDIASYDIERGRNHGLPGYTAFREFCGLSVPQTYEDLEELMPLEVVLKFRELYGEDGLDNIDLMSAAISEFRNLTCNAAVGPTYACIITENYRRMKRGDRFWFENQGFAGSFTPEQIAEIRKTTLAGLICRNTELQELQDNVLLVPGPWNMIRSCEEIMEQTKMNMSLFTP